MFNVHDRCLDTSSRVITYRVCVECAIALMNRNMMRLRGIPVCASDTARGRTYKARRCTVLILAGLPPLQRSAALVLRRTCPKLPFKAGLSTKKKRGDLPCYPRPTPCIHGTSPAGSPACIALLPGVFTPAAALTGVLPSDLLPDRHTALQAARSVGK